MENSILEFKHYESIKNSSFTKCWIETDDLMLQNYFQIATCYFTTALRGDCHGYLLLWLQWIPSGSLSHQLRYSHMSHPSYKKCQGRNILFNNTNKESFSFEVPSKYRSRLVNNLTRAKPLNALGHRVIDSLVFFVFF